MQKRETQLVLIACSVRLLVWLIAFLSDYFIEDHDYSTDLMTKTSDQQENSLVVTLFRCFVRWDAHFFLEIAKNGYLFLKNHAFFPLFPMTIRYFKIWVIDSLTFSSLRELDSLILSGVVLNFCFHVVAVLIFYRLSKIYIKNESLAWKSAILYCLSPASIFFSALYSESLYNLLTFVGLYALYSSNDEYRPRNILLAAVFFALATLVRSTGLFYLLLIAIPMLHHLIQELFGKKGSISQKVQALVSHVGLGAIVVGVVTSAFVAVQYIPYSIYCKSYDRDIMGIPEKPSWCNETPPNAYRYIQLHFWGVEFLSSYRLSNIFNIYWGMHMLVIFAIFLSSYLRRNFLNTMFLGIPKFLDNQKEEKNADFFYSTKNVPIILFSLLGFVINAFFAYIQCSTRILSANPMIYWYAAYYMSTKRKGETKNNEISFRRHWIFIYFVHFMLSGCVIYTNFYLFT